MAMVCAMIPVAFPRADVYAWAPPPAERSSFCKSGRSSSWAHEFCSTSATSSSSSTKSGDEGEDVRMMQHQQPSHKHEPKTFFRRWTVPAADPEDLDELVPGLRAAFRDAGMGDQCISAEKWCLEVGAAFLSEVLEEVDDLFEVISTDTSPCSACDDEEQVDEGLVDGSCQGDGRLQHGGTVEEAHEAQIEQLRAALTMRCAQLAQRGGRPASPSFGQHVSPVQPAKTTTGKGSACVVRRVEPWQLQDYFPQPMRAPILHAYIAAQPGANSKTNTYQASLPRQQEKVNVATCDTALTQARPRLW
eukprot:TRINITY_DN81818_c0_g1_i1.p1 TRINITY_DN81818_c0_g1~~TRINITY_DN81818_c0_g1_i1.p1  ORF type:complete len:304 (+),score=44.05 TRINITY_DN81818_c0_g1_i1:87-998(+)